MLQPHRRLLLAALAAVILIPSLGSVALAESAVTNTVGTSTRLTGRDRERHAIDQRLVAGLRAYVLDDKTLAIGHWTATLQAYRRLGEAEGVIVSLLGLRQAQATEADYGKDLKAAIQNDQPPENRPAAALYEAVGLALVYPQLDDITKPFLPVYADLAEAIVSGQSLRQIDTLNAVAQTHLNFGDVARAVELAEQANQLNPQLLSPQKRQTIAKQLSQSYFLMGENALAVEFHQLRLANIADRPVTSPETAEPHLNLARSYAAIGQYALARGQYQNLYQRSYPACPKTTLQISTEQSNCQDAADRAFATNKAHAYAASGKYIMALKNMDKAAAIRSRMQTRMVLSFFYDTMTTLATLAETQRNSKNGESSHNPNKPKLLAEGKPFGIEIRIGLLKDIFTANLAFSRSEQYVSGQVNVLIGLGRGHASVGEFAQALERYKEGLILARKSADREREWAALVGMSRAYESLGDLLQAQEHYKQSLALVPMIQQKDGLHAQIQMQNAYRAIGEYGSAIRFYQRSLDLAQISQDETQKVQALIGLGQSYEALDQSGTKYYQEANTVATTPENQLTAQLALGKSEYERGNYAQAKGLAEKIQSLGTRLKNFWATRSALVLLGEIAFIQGDPTSAIRYHQMALVTSQSLNRQEEYKDKASIRAELLDWINLGKAQLQGNQSLAVTSYQKALEVAAKLDAPSKIMAHQNLGKAYLAQRNYAAALDTYKAALPLTYKPQDLQAEAIILTNIGVLQHQVGDRKAAEKTLFDALKIQESLQRNTADRNKISVSETQQTAYDVLQQVLVAQQKYDAALAVAERGRARTFANQLNQRISKNNQPNGEIIDLSRPRTQSPQFQPLSIDSMRDLANRRKTTMVVYSIVQKADAGLALGNAASKAPAESSLYMWVIKPDRSVHFRSVDAPAIRQQWTQMQANTKRTCEGDSGNLATSPITCWVESMQQQIGVRNRNQSAASPANQGNSAKALNQLHNLLIQPIADLLPQNPTEQVTIVPQGALFLVPFAALKNDNGQYLIQNHTLSVTASLSSLDLLTQLAQINTKTSSGTSTSGRLDLVVGNPTMPQIGDPPEPLEALPGAEKEANAIAALLKTKALIGGEATKSVVLGRLKTARRVHLATHGFFDDVRGTGSAIALAPDRAALPIASVSPSLSSATIAASAPQLFTVATREIARSNLFNQEVNGLLTAQEIAGQSLRADLVVLSACNTGQGRITGDGVIGLSRSFLTAGATSVVVSLWAVPDAPTAALMELFYTNLQSTPDKAQALRQAMLTMLQSRSDPKDWAAFMLIGETNSF
jgi:CHAT domain-containing protein